jgi:hypothetical protein
MLKAHINLALHSGPDKFRRAIASFLEASPMRSHVCRAANRGESARSVREGMRGVEIEI